MVLWMWILTFNCKVSFSNYNIPISVWKIIQSDNFILISFNNVIRSHYGILRAFYIIFHSVFWDLTLIICIFILSRIFMSIFINDALSYLIQTIYKILIIISIIFIIRFYQIILCILLQFVSIFKFFTWFTMHIVMFVIGLTISESITIIIVLNFNLFEIYLRQRLYWIQSTIYRIFIPILYIIIAASHWVCVGIIQQILCWFLINYILIAYDCIKFAILHNILIPLYNVTYSKNIIRIPY